MKKIQMPRFINAELKSDLESSDLDYNKLMTKVKKSGGDSK